MSFRLLNLLERQEYEVVYGDVSEALVTSLIYDSRKVIEGSVFVCIKGANFDGHDAALDVIKKGAGALIVERVPEDVQSLIDTKSAELSGKTIVKVQNTRYALAFLSAAYFGFPAEKLEIIGVTGTKGKTTTTYLIKSILEHAGHKVGLVGTIEVIIGDLHIHADNTTPESYVLQEYFAKMADSGIDTVVMEVSSQALMLHRTQGFIFDYGVFTNIEPDHIGPNEHSDFDDYINCKSLLFKQCRIGVLNGDDPHLERILKNHTCEVQTYGLSKSLDIYAENVELIKKPDELGVSFDIRGKSSIDRLEVGTPGKFSIYNALSAVAVTRNFGVSLTDLRTALEHPHVRGRIERVKVSDNFTLMIDYAHNAMALESLLTSIREYEPKRLVTVFGCGGNRSKYRRFEMGEVSGKLSDLTIITSDNPRFEEPEAIISDIETGIKKTEGKYIKISDRKEAIRYAIEHGEPGDVIILAGKGHEDYQEIKGVKYPMDERILIKEVLEEL